MISQSLFEHTRGDFPPVGVNNSPPQMGVQGVFRVFRILPSCDYSEHTLARCVFKAGKGVFKSGHVRVEWGQSW
jgi:hypothetical protein